VLDPPLKCASRIPLVRHLVCPPRRALPTLAPLTHVLVAFFTRGVNVIIEINRDFPFQVPLSFDEAAMDVLDRLEGCAFEWTMYIDLPANTVRYCFRKLEDAVACSRSL
jgi:hypothetical protein